MRRLLWVAVAVAALTVVVSSVNRASPRIAFMGDSLTEWWAFPRVNLGIHGQTTAQMLARFPAQVRPGEVREVVILGGTNDTLLGIAPAVTLTNLTKMVELARAEGVRPVLAEIPPIYQQDGRYLAAAEELDRGIARLAAEKQVSLVDYNGALLGHPRDFSDGIHMKRRGYLRMEWALMKVENPFWESRP